MAAFHQLQTPSIFLSYSTPDVGYISSGNRSPALFETSRPRRSRNGDVTVNIGNIRAGPGNLPGRRRGADFRLTFRPYRRRANMISATPTTARIAPRVAHGRWSSMKLDAGQ
jgi:hypothetical protein